MAPRLFIVIPCYNEQEVLPITAPMFLDKIKSHSAAGKISEASRVLFVNGGGVKAHRTEVVQNCHLPPLSPLRGQLPSEGSL